MVSAEQKRERDDDGGEDGAATHPDVIPDTEPTSLLAASLPADSRVGAILQLTKDGVVQDYLNAFLALVSDIDPQIVERDGLGAFVKLRQHIEKLHTYRDHVEHLIGIGSISGLTAQEVMDAAKRDISRLDPIIAEIQAIGFSDFESVQVTETLAKIERLKVLVNEVGEVIFGPENWKNRNGPAIIDGIDYSHVDSAQAPRVFGGETIQLPIDTDVGESVI